MEIGQLAMCQDNMRIALDKSTKDLKESKDKLEDYSRSLEAKVEARAREILSKANELETLNLTVEERIKREVEEDRKQARV